MIRVEVFKNYELAKNENMLNMAFVNTIFRIRRRIKQSESDEPISIDDIRGVKITLDSTEDDLSWLNIVINKFKDFPIYMEVEYPKGITFRGDYDYESVSIMLTMYDKIAECFDFVKVEDFYTTFFIYNNEVGKELLKEIESQKQLRQA